MATWRYENLFSCDEKYFTCSLRSLVKYSSIPKEKFRISVRPRNILYIFNNVISTHSYQIGGKNLLFVINKKITSF